MEQRGEEIISIYLGAVSLGPVNLLGKRWESVRSTCSS